MPQYSYGISASTSATTNVESLTTPLNPPRSTYNEWSRIYDRSDGSSAGDGYPSAVWHFDYLTQAQVTQLRTFCTGRSASVYITTRINTGAFATYTAQMIWPGDLLQKRQFGGRFASIDIQFRKLEAV